MRNIKDKMANRILEIIIYFLVIVALIPKVNVSGEELLKKTDIWVSSSCPYYTITNADGDSITYDDEKEEYIEDGLYWLDTNCIDIDEIIDVITVEESSSFTFISPFKNPVFFRVRNVGKKEEYSLTVEAENFDKITVYTEKGQNKIEVEGTDCEYKISAIMGDSENDYIVSGKTNGKVVMEQKETGVAISGIKDTIVSLEAWDLSGEGADIVETKQKVYAYEDTITMVQKGKDLFSTGTGKINSKTSKTMDGVSIEPANNGQNLMLTWNKVKRAKTKKIKGYEAKSYVIYKYNVESKQYEQIAVNAGYNNNYLDIPNLVDNEKYMYKVRASASRDGIGGYIGKASYPVYAISDNSVKSNVIKLNLCKVKLKKKALQIKRKKTKKLKVKFVGQEGKSLISKKVTWLTSNKKIATINKFGKINAKRKGTCYVWARAHNGIESRKLKIRVVK